MANYYSFDEEYFELPFGSDCTPVSEEDQSVEYNIVYVRNCAKGYMLFSLTHKFFFYKASKEAKNLLIALDEYVQDKSLNACITYTLTQKGLPKFGVKLDAQKGFWVQDITGYSFMEASWNSGSISEASNEFLLPGAKGETEERGQGQKTTKGQNKSSTK